MAYRGDRCLYDWALCRASDHRAVYERKAHPIQTLCFRQTDIYTRFFWRFSLPAEIGYAFGLIQYHFVLYIIVTIIAEVPLAFLTIQASDAFVHLEFFSFIGWIVALGFFDGGLIHSVSSETTATLRKCF